MPFPRDRLNFNCDSCQHRYSVPDDKIRGKTVRVRCRHCGHLTSVTGPAESAAEAAAFSSAAASSSPPPVADRADWYAMVRGAQAGPFDLTGLGDLLRRGDATEQTYVWRPGMAEWLRAGDLPELAFLFAPAAPPPAPTPWSTPDDEALPPAASAPMPSAVLFSDENAPPAEDAPGGRMPVASPRKKDAEEHVDPFAALGALDPADLPPPGESTMFFIQQAGVNKRNPPWKIAAFIGGGVGAVALVLLLLSSLNVVPLTVRAVNDDGEAVEQSVFSADGVSRLGDVLLGKAKTAPQKDAEPGTVAAGANETRKRASAKSQRAVGSSNAAGQDEEEVLPTAAELASLYEDTARSDKGPRVRRSHAQDVAAPVTATGSLSEEQIHKVVTASQSAFQLCIEQELRKNPNLRMPRFFIRATVGNSGTVTAASIDRREVNTSNLGECLKSRAKRMTFAPFEGDELVVEIPLIVGVSM